jgi:hypothetical protein
VTPPGGGGSDEGDDPDPSPSTGQSGGFRTVLVPPLPAPAAFATTPLSNTLVSGSGSIGGNVRQLGGVGVAGVSVVIVSATDPTKRAVLMTDAGGGYAVNGIAYGGYFVLAVPPDGRAYDAKPRYVVFDYGGLTNVNFSVGASTVG